MVAPQGNRDGGFPVVGTACGGVQGGLGATHHTWRDEVFICSVPYRRIPSSSAAGRVRERVQGSSQR